MNTHKKIKEESLSLHYEYMQGKYHLLSLLEYSTVQQHLFSSPKLGTKKTLARKRKERKGIVGCRTGRGMYSVMRVWGFDCVELFG